MKTFHHGGRIGDCIYALYTVWWMYEHWQADEVTFILSDFHQRNWGEKEMAALLPLIGYQSYIKDVLPVRYHDYDDIENVNYDLRRAEDDFNPEIFPEWTGPNWPGNCHIAKRYSQHFGIKFEPETVWLTAPKADPIDRYDVVIHAPKRRCTDFQALNSAVTTLHLRGYKVAVIDFEADWSLAVNVIKPAHLLKTAEIIDSAKVFIGAVSSCACIAEGLKKRRLIQIADDCDNTFHAGRTGKNINGWSGDQIANIAEMMIKNG